MTLHNIIPFKLWETLTNMPKYLTILSLCSGWIVLIGGKKVAFLRFRNLKTDENGNVVSGTGVILTSKYNKNPNSNNHSKQEVQERLGKVVEVYGPKRALFQSPTRGLVIYDGNTNTFSDPLTKEEIEKSPTTEHTKGKIFPDSCVHTVFGDVYLLLESMKQSGIIDVFKAAFPDRVFLERLLCHVLHGILRDGSKITCDDFIHKSFASYFTEDVPNSSLKSDTAFFSAMGKDEVRIAFFEQYVELMRKEHPDFGNACIVDSTPLPNDINSPFNALCSHGVSSTSNQMRLVLVLDEKTSCPVWLDIVPGNILDLSTIDFIKRDVKASLGIDINAFFLDAGYATQAFIKSFTLQKKNGPVPEKRYVMRMPAKNGYPHEELYKKWKKSFMNPKYIFVRDDHAYFGHDQTVKIAGVDVRAYVYRDERNASKVFAETYRKDPQKFEKLSNHEKEWIMHKGGFFILIANYLKTPAEMLDEYFSRTSIETVFKTDKEYLKLLPLCKWTDDTVRGKILSDIIDSIVRQSLRDQVKEKGVTWSMTSLIGKCQSLMCCRDSENVYVEPANKQVKQYYKDCGIEIPSELNLSQYIDELYEKKDENSVVSNLAKS